MAYGEEMAELGYDADTEARAADEAAAAERAAQEAENQALLRELMNQRMTQGLGENPTGNGQMAYTGPWSGYAGPMRQDDVPSFQAGADIPVFYGAKNPMESITMSPGTEMARQEMVRQQPVGQGNMGQIMDLIQGMKGVPDQLKAQLLSQRFPGVFEKPMTQLENQKALAQFNYNLRSDEREDRAEDRKDRQQDRKLRLKDMELRTDALIADREARHRIPIKDAKLAMKRAFEAGERDPIKLAILAKGMGYQYGGGTSNAGLSRVAGTGFEPNLMVPPMRTGRNANAKAKLTDRKIAKQFLDSAGGDIARAKEMAAALGWEF
jgi:hypothetical protein